MALTDSKNDTENISADTGVNYQTDTREINVAQTVNPQTASRTFDQIGTAAAEYNDADTGILEAPGYAPANLSNEITEDSPLSRAVPLVLLFLLIGLGYAFCRNPAA